jgi:hypothetical protein
MFLLKRGRWMNGNMPQMGGCTINGNGLLKTEDAACGTAMCLQRSHHLEGNIAQWCYYGNF